MTERHITTADTLGFMIGLQCLAGEHMAAEANLLSLLAWITFDGRLDRVWN